MKLLHNAQLIIGSRLGNKFALFIIILASVPVLVLGFTALMLLGVSHRQDVSTLELQLIDQKIEEIEKFLSDTLGIIELRVGFTQISEIEESQQQFLLQGLLEENTAFDEVSFINLAGQETAKEIREGAAIELLDVSRLEKFRVASAGGRFIGDIYHTLSGPFVTLAAPVHNRNGNIIQVLSAEVNLSRIKNAIEKSILGSSGYAMLIDQDGILVASGATSGKAGEDLSGRRRVAQILRGDLLDGSKDSDRYTSILNGSPVVGAGKRISETKWAVLVEWPLADADAVIADVRSQVVTMTIFSIAVVLVLVPFFVNRFLRPIRKLQAMASDVEKGEWDKRVDIKTHDELEDLGSAFNKMAAGLKHLQEIKDEFVFIAAHELRSPVTVIRGYISLALEEGKNLSENLRRYLVEADHANKRLLQLVQDLLEAARSEAGRISVKLQPIRIEDSVKASLDELKPLADEKSIKIHYEEPGGLPSVLADEGRVKEIIINLAGNSIKYTPHGGNIWISQVIKNNTVITSVKDDGFGISKEAQERLFEKFYRVRTEKTRDIQGTGLGLFIVQELINKMNGTVWMESEEGRGSQFSFSLPTV